MKLTKIMFTVCLLFHASVLLSQESVVVTGKVYDDMGPLLMANVLEIDINDRIVSQAVTDINGEFSLSVKNKKNRIKISYVGCKILISEIGEQKVFSLKMESDNTLAEAVVTAKKMHTSGGLTIPEREVSSAVQTIEAKEFEGLAISSIDEALQGRIAGLDIVYNSGDLGAGTSMRLRGVSSISSSSEPLIVVDGEVWNSKEDYDVSNATSEQFADLLAINPEDIESITVLKDAASTAIWGSQGANGVIMIKTKRGERGPIKLSYSYRVNGSIQPEGYNMLDGDNYTMFLKESHYNPTQSDRVSEITELNYDRNFSEYEQYNNNTDWIEAVKQLGAKQQHFLSISGGGEKATMRMSLGYDNETGSIIGQRLDRLTFRMNLDYFVSKRIKFSSNLSFSLNDNDKNSDALLSIAYKKMPNLAIYKQDSYGNDTDEFYHVLESISPELKDQKLVNPIASAYYAKNNQKSYSISPQFNIRYNFLGTESYETKLEYQGSVSLGISYSDSEKFYPSILTTSLWSSSGINSTSLSQDKSIGFNTRHQLIFVPAFNNEDHSLSSLFRIEASNSTSNSQSSSSYGHPNGSITSPTVQGYVSGMSTGSGQGRSVYLAFSTHYSYKSKYSVDLSVRRDASTKFGGSHRWGTFPAISFRWNIIDEGFMENTKDWLSMLSIRPGWGQAGKSPGGEYLHYSVYVSDGSYTDMQGMRPENIRLSDLRWETTSTYNLGTDVGFLNDKISANIDLYSQIKSDLLMSSYRIPSSSGFSTLKWKNNGKMRNQGWDVNINARDVIKKGDFSMHFNMVLGNNYNTVLEMDENILRTHNKEFSYKNGEYLTRVQCYNAFGSIYGFRYKGVYSYSNYIEGVQENAPVARDANGDVILDSKGNTLPMYFAYGTSASYTFKGGDAIYEDVNHDGNINELDIVYLGNSNPILTGGFGFKFNYKQFSLNSQFNYRFGNKIVNKARMNAENMYSHNNQTYTINWRWRKEGDGANGEPVIPRALYQTGYNWLASDRYVEDGAFIRLNYLQLAYNLPRNSLKKLGLSRVNISATINNLFCLTGYSGLDPEVGYGSWNVSEDSNQTPRPKSYTLNLNIGF